MYKTNQSVLAALLLSVLAMVLLPSLAPADSRVVISTANDDFSGNSESDDLYSSVFSLTINFNREFEKADPQSDRPNRPSRGFILFQENLFTDKENGLRFDETWLLVGKRVERSRWGLAYFAGTVRVGKGLIGERGQNAVHRLIGDDEVEIAYVPNSETYAAAGLTLNRLLFASHRMTLEAAGDLRYAQDFQQHVAARLDTQFVVTDWLDIFASLGVRASWTQYKPLEPWIDGVAPTFQFGVKICDQVQVTWSSNQYGTEKNHVSLAFTVSSKWDRARRNS